MQTLRAPPSVVLVVDDSRVARATVEARLTRQGLAVVAAGARAEAETIDTADLAAALLDLELADGNGVDVAERLRAARAGLPIAFLTSAPASDLARRARAFGPVFEKGTGTDEAIAWAARSVSG
jgi:DNA-binding response OmpR family regulator